MSLSQTTASCDYMDPVISQHEADMIGLTGEVRTSRGRFVSRIRHWPKPLSRWGKAVEDLAVGREVLQLLGLGLQIDVFEVNLPMDRKQQATFEAALDCLAKQVAGYLDIDSRAAEINSETREEQASSGPQHQSELEEASDAELGHSSDVAGCENVFTDIGSNKNDDSGVRDNEVADEDIEDVEEEANIEEDEDVRLGFPVTVGNAAWQPALPHTTIAEYSTNDRNDCNTGVVVQDCDKYRE
ncbi:hypothetical protein FS837_000071 [Tulasnella sp. UAMH 9824]|nr:hypothetical protein FS837_000071 [Tulasnella sp. UAMH 9824]